MKILTIPRKAVSSLSHACAVGVIAGLLPMGAAAGPTIEFGDPVRVPTTDDLAQPVPGEATVAAGDSDPDTSSGSSGWGTGAIDYGPDHVEIRTDGPWLEPDVPDLDAPRDQEDDFSDE